MCSLQVKKLVSRASHRDQFNYRKLTDKPLTEKLHAALATLASDYGSQQKTDYIGTTSFQEFLRIISQTCGLSQT